MRRVTKIVGAATLASAATIAALATTATAAPADTSAAGPWTCSAGGFTGQLKVEQHGGNEWSVSYRIDKGGNGGGNKADVNVYDDGMPNDRVLASTSNGVQNGGWHGIYHGQARPDFVHFRFDKSNANDPGCWAP